MTFETLRADIEGARTHARLDELAPRIWRELDLENEEAQELASKLSEAMHARRRAIDAEGSGPLRHLGTALQGRCRSIFKPRRHQVSPDRAKSRDRRRKLALSGPMPPALAMRFTIGQLAVLGVVANEVVQGEGPCTLCVEAIAAAAGVSRRLAQTALRLAEGDGLLSIEERPRKGQPHDTNRVRILSKDWRAWIERRHRNALRKEAAAKAVTGGGRRNVRPSNFTDPSVRSKRPDGTQIRATGEEMAGASGPDRPRPSMADSGAGWRRSHAPRAYGRSS
ncbi:MAG: hypothetical protein INR70_31705 [Parafilimonas terrae]|nr:hypothetical protein [Parafilimonas terrae]